MATGPSLVGAASFAVLAGTTVTNSGVTTVVGDVGVSPGTSINNLAPGAVRGTIHAGDDDASLAESDVSTAYKILAEEAVNTSLTNQDLGGLTLTPGVYNFASAAQLHGTLTLDAQGSTNAVFVLQIGSTLTTATNSVVVLVNGAQASNVFWQVGSSATLGTGSKFQGNILALTSIALDGGADISPGRALAIDGAVTMDSNAISKPMAISGVVFLDLNATGAITTRDPGLAGRVVFVDLHGDGILHADDPQAVTDSLGQFGIEGLTAGQYTLRVKTFANDDPTGPSGNQTAIDLTTGQDVTIANFGLLPGSSIVSRTPTPTPFAGGTTPQEAVIESLYRTLLGRAGQPAEIQSWVHTSQAFSVMATKFLESPEYRTKVIEADYSNFLGRAAEPAGLDHWLTAFQEGSTETQIAETFVTLPEYNARYATPSAYVESLYSKVLGRDATPSEITIGNQQLTGGMKESTFAADVIESTEAYLRGINGDYTAFLARVGDAPSVDQWVTQLEQGTMTLADAEEFFVNSPEFVARAANSL